MKEGIPENPGAIRGEFSRLYHLTRPFSDHVFYSAIGERFVLEWMWERGREDPLDQVKSDITERGEDPDELVLLAILRSQLPEGVDIPDEFKGIKTYILISQDD
jgi:hypothetical protein